MACECSRGAEGWTMMNAQEAGGRVARRPPCKSRMGGNGRGGEPQGKAGGRPRSGKVSKETKCLARFANCE